MSVFCKKLLRFLLHAQYNCFSNPIHKQQWWILIEKKVVTDGCVILDNFHKFFFIVLPFFSYFDSYSSLMYRKLYSSSKYLKLCSECIICILEAVIYLEIMCFDCQQFSVILDHFYPLMSQTWSQMQEQVF